MQRLTAALAACLLLRATASADAVLEDVRLFSDGARIYLSEPTDYKTFLLSSPRRIVVDLLRTSHLGKPRKLAGPGLISALRTDQFVSPPLGVARVVLVLAAGAGYDIVENPEGLSVLVSPAPKDLKDAVQEPVLQDGAQAERQDAAWLDDVQAAESQAALYLTARTEQRAFYLDDPPRLVLDLHGVRRRRWQRPVEITSGVLRAVRTGIQSAEPPVIRVVFDLAQAVPYTASWDRGRLLVEFEPAEAGAAPQENVSENGVRDFTGLLLDAAGRGLDGTYSLRFFWPGGTLEEFWSESVEIRAQQGFFSARLGLTRPVPYSAEIEVAAAPGSGWRVIPTDPRP